jgi:hypothetical protein
VNLTPGLVLHPVHLIEKYTAFASASVLLCSSENCMGCLFDFDGLGSLSFFLNKAVKLENVDVLKLEELSDVVCISDDMLMRSVLVWRSDGVYTFG